MLQVGGIVLTAPYVVRQLDFLALLLFNQLFLLLRLLWDD